MIAACTVAMALGAAPVIATGAEHGDPSPGLQQALEVRAEVDAINETAREQAPDAVRGRCDATMDVPGIGDSCVAPDGLIRVEQADGRSHTIHGLDAPPVGAQAYSSQSQLAVSEASASSIRCVDAGQPRYVLVYAFPADVTSRYATIAPRLRTETYKLSAFIDSESRSVNATSGQLLPMQCAEGVSVVRSVRLSGLTSGSADFNQIVDGMRAAGYQFNGDQGNDERYVVYYDSPSPSGAAGTGHVFTTDSSASPSNSNNRGGLFAIEYRYDGGGAVPHWDVLIHEVMHTMGGVVNDAPHSSGAGHCTDGQDVMCYRDTASTAYDPSACSVKVLDCGRDDYFNPAPAASSFLESHWNVAGSYNRFLLHETGSDTRTPMSTAPDSVRPDAPGRVTAHRTPSRLILRWSRAADNVGVTQYEVRRLVQRTRTSVRVARSSGRTARQAFAIPLAQLRSGFHVFEVVAIDAAGNVSLGTRIRVRIPPDRIHPTAPPRARVIERTPDSATIGWDASSDNIGVASYRVLQLVGDRWVVIQRRLDSTLTSLRITQLQSDLTYRFQVRAIDAAGNVSGSSNTVRISIA